MSNWRPAGHMWPQEEENDQQNGWEPRYTEKLWYWSTKTHILGLNYAKTVKVNSKQTSFFANEGLSWAREHLTGSRRRLYFITVLNYRAQNYISKSFNVLLAKCKINRHDLKWEIARRYHACISYLLFIFLLLNLHYNESPAFH